jgi:hypothetical protein
MKAIELFGNIDGQRQLQADVPKGLPTGHVRLIVLLPDDDEVGTIWDHHVAREWSIEFSDPAEDIYTLADGYPVNAAK